MRILHIISYVSPDGAYGGPLRVALNQSKSLSSKGHDVVMVGAAGDFNGPFPSHYAGQRARLYKAYKIVPKLGFSGIFSPRLLTSMVSAYKKADIVHVHVARDLVSLPAAALVLLARKPLVVQTHGMIDRSTKLLAVPLDRMITIPVLRRASAVLHLTDAERKDLLDVAGGNLALECLTNGVRVSTDGAIEQQTGPASNPEVLFMARLHARKRPTLMVRAAERISLQHQKARFTLVGPDEGEAEAVQKDIANRGLEQRVVWEGPLSPDLTNDRLRQASIFASPSINEPFGMSVVEAMAVGLPVVITNSCGLAPIVSAYKAGLVCDESEEGFVSAVESLIRNPILRQSMGKNAQKAVTDLFSIDEIGDRLMCIYESAIAHHGIKN